MLFNAEFTDTFGGEANYAWVKRTTVENGNDSDRHLVKVVKARFGLTGVPCKREEWGDTIVLRPKGTCTVVFISPAE